MTIIRRDNPTAQQIVERLSLEHAVATVDLRAAKGVAV